MNKGLKYACIAGISLQDSAFCHEKDMPLVQGHNKKRENKNNIWSKKGEITPDTAGSR